MLELSPETLPNSASTVGLRPVTPEDDAFLLGVYDNSRDAELSQVEWPPGRREMFVKSQFRAQHSEYMRRFPDAEYYVVLFDDTPAGRLWTGTAGDEIRLLDIAILPPFQNKGVGTLLFKRLLAEADRTQKTLRHVVFYDNPGALRFYQRLGFVVVEEVGAHIHMERLPSPANPASSDSGG